MKARFWNCERCGWSFIIWVLMKNQWVCNICIESKLTVEDFKKTVVMPSFVKTVDEVMDSIWEPVERVSILMPSVYTASYLNHKRNINLNVIKKGTKTIEYRDGYILKEDVINLFIWQLKKTD